MFQRMSNGWKLAKSSLALLNNNRSLLLFPLLSGLAIIAIIGSFVGTTGFLFGDQINALMDSESTGGLILASSAMFLFYLVAFFFATFFNAALIHCTMKIMAGEETSVSEGIQFASSKINKIIQWTLLAATVGMILKIIQQTGKLGEIVSAIIGVAWSVVTFFAIPVLIYQDLGVFDTVKESTRIMKAKWGESLTGNFSFGMMYIVGIALAILIGLIPGVGIIIAPLLILVLILTFTAAKFVLIAAIYNHTNQQPIGSFNEEILDSAFLSK